MSETHDPSFTTQNERILASISHISILFSTIGLIVPVIVWITQKEKSKFVAFQSLQALSLQIARMAIQILLGFGLMFSFLILIMFSEYGGSSSFESTFLLFNLSIVCIMGLVSFIFIFYSIIGAARSFQGASFQYPIIGKRLKRYLKSNYISANQGTS